MYNENYNMYQNYHVTKLHICGLEHYFTSKPLLSCFLNAEAVVKNTNCVRFQGPFEDLPKAYKVPAKTTRLQTNDDFDFAFKAVWREYV